MINFSTDQSYGKIHNSLEAFFQRYENIEEFLCDLDSDLFDAGLGTGEEVEESGKDRVLS
jgi:hypothetical protein